MKSKNYTRKCTKSNIQWVPGGNHTKSVIKSVPKPWNLHFGLSPGVVVFFFVT